VRSVGEQVGRLVELGIVPGDTPAPAGEGLVVVHPDLVPPSRLAVHVRLDDKAGFVVVDMPDLDAFVPIDEVTLPSGPLYVVRDPQRGDEMANWSPDEALPAIQGAGRCPMTTSEGISWLLQEPERLERNHCFMTIGSRRPADRRTPAIWVSNGTGRDGAERRGAPKVGWCWAGNRHTWLGFASVAERY
jgi:hypothetical protein